MEGIMAVGNGNKRCEGKKSTRMDAGSWCGGNGSGSNYGKGMAVLDRLERLSGACPRRAFAGGGNLEKSRICGKNDRNILGKLITAFRVWRGTPHPAERKLEDQTALSAISDSDMDDGTGAWRENAYLTLEAALVFPIVLAVQFLAIGLLFFQYDRCLLNMDMAYMTVVGCEGEKRLQAVTGTLYREKYVLWSWEQIDAEMTKGKVRIAAMGKLKYPFWIENQYQWETKAAVVYEGKQLEPVFFIRQYRKAMGQKEEKDAANGIYQESEL